MKSTGIKYFIKEGFRSFWVNRLMSLASIVIVFFCLLAFGLYIIISMNLNYIGTQLNAMNDLQAYISTETSAVRVTEIGAELRAIDNVASVEFISKEERFAESVTSPEAIEGYGSNPLRDSYRITMKDVSLVDPLLEKVKLISEVQHVSYNKDLMISIMKTLRGVNIAGVCLALFMALMSIFIISSTIKITVFSRRKDINIMKFVGATDGFIRWPFIVEGLIISIIGSLIAFFSITNIYSWVISKVPLEFSEILTFTPSWQIRDISAAILLGTGILLGCIGSAVSVRKHLHV